MRTHAISLLVALVAAGCGSAGEVEPEPQQVTDLSVSSTAFAEGDEIPAAFTCDGADVPPDLSWDGVPAGTVEVVVVVDDPDAPGGTFTHWIVWSIDPGSRSLEAGAPADALEGENDFGEVGYRGPCPPEVDEPHRYRFRVVALDSRVDLPEGARPEEVSEAIDDHVVGVGELTASYSR